MTRTTLINALIARRDYRSYLEIGLGNGAHFRAIRCAEKESVDPGGPGCSQQPTHRLTSDEFFARNQRRFDLIFIDGLHHCENVERDIHHALAALTPGGMIVCHDMNPTSREMQLVPRQTRDWTGDAWKAWVRLRQQHPGLPCVVAETDYGLGIIFPSGPRRQPPPVPAEAELNWEGLVRNRHWWLNLVPAAEIEHALFAETPHPLQCVTLWSHRPHAGQLALADYLARAEFPPTRFLWALTEIMAGTLAPTRELLHSRGHGVELRIFTPPPGDQGQSPREKHARVTWLYNQLLPDLAGDHVLFIEDDNVPVDADAVPRLLRALQQADPAVACIGGAYRSRPVPHRACASTPRGYLSWARLAAGLQPVRWLGGGFTLYRLAHLRTASPFHFHHSPGQGRVFKGWDMCLADAFATAGKTQLLDGALRVEHRCDPVIDWCRQHQQPLA